MNRRHFLQSAAVAGAGTLILPRTRLFGADAPSNKLNIALLGTWGRGEAHFNAIATQNVVALCDVNEEHLAGAAKRFPSAKTYVDWRQCLDQKDINAIVCCTADHTHAFIAGWALNRGMHIYMEKPLAITVEEARFVRAKYMKLKSKIATQVGMQRHAHPNFDRVRELVLDGAIGDLEAVSAWGNRQIPRPGYLPAQGEPPKHFHFDLWLGPSPAHPYNPGYFSGGPGMNCLQWNMFWDFGCGQIGDMGSHTMDLAWNAMDAALPTAIEAKGDPYNPDVTPVKLAAHYDFPANPWRKAIRVSWYQGGAMPESPIRSVDLNKIDHGAMFEGSRGTLVADFTTRFVIPVGDKADFTYFKRRTPDTVIPPMGGFQEQWLNACKGDLKTACDFEYSSNMIETMLLGLVAYRAGSKLNYDPVAGRVTNQNEANAYLGKKYRDGWTMDG